MRDAQRERIAVGALGVTFLVESDDSNGSACVFECEVPPNANMPVPHSHDGFEETIYGLTGRTTYTVAGETFELNAGDSICIGRGVVHGFANHGDETATFLAIITPALFGSSYFRDIADVLKASASGPPDKAAMGAVMTKHGLTPAPPPPA
jgi:quercetin dioxygenase-like cupin family protein